MRRPRLASGAVRPADCPTPWPGAVPYAGLIADAAGNLFGTTATGGVRGQGTVFEIVKTASGYASIPKALVSFCGQTSCIGGSIPDAGLIADASGDLFGSAEYGGGKNSGTVFEIAGTGFVTGARFASLRVTLLISGGHHPGFVLDANFGLGSGSKGIDPPMQPLTLAVGPPYTAMVPAGSFRRLPAGRTITVHAFRRTLSNTSLALDILSLGAKKFQFGAAVSPVDLTAAAQPIPVSLAIGNDNGTTAAKTITLH